MWFDLCFFFDWASSFPTPAEEMLERCRIHSNPCLAVRDIRIHAWLCIILIILIIHMFSCNFIIFIVFIHPPTLQREQMHAGALPNPFEFAPWRRGGKRARCRIHSNSLERCRIHSNSSLSAALESSLESSLSQQH